MSANLKEKYQKEIIKELSKNLKLRSIAAAPKIEKIVINSGIGRIIASDPQVEKTSLPQIMEDLALLTSQKPAVRQAKKSIASLKVRKGMKVGLMVTLRGKKMYDFLERLVNIVLPRVRDFRGIDLNKIDGRGNLTIGIKEHTVFPEINLEKTKVVFGLEVTIVPKAKNREEAIILYKLMGIPIKFKKLENRK